jgi:hypothetical protein
MVGGFLGRVPYLVVCPLLAELAPGVFHHPHCVVVRGFHVVYLARHTPQPFHEVVMRAHRFPPSIVFARESRSSSLT